MDNKEMLKIKIREAFVIKSREGQDDKEIYEQLTEQFHRFITREPGFTSKNISRGMRELVTEKNRNQIIIALADIYFDYVKRNPEPTDKCDIAIKSKLKETDDTIEIIRTAFNEEVIKRMRRCGCCCFFRRGNEK